MIWTTVTLGFFCFLLSTYHAVVFICFITVLTLIRIYDWYQAHSD